MCAGLSFPLDRNVWFRQVKSRARVNPGIGVHFVPKLCGLKKQRGEKNRGGKNRGKKEGGKNRRKYPGIGVTLVPKLVIGRLNTHMVMQERHPGCQPV